jgi:hypothetical protein
MTTQPIIPGTNAFFAPESATITRESKPAANGTDYKSLGATAEGSEVEPSIGVERKIYANDGGTVVLKDVVEGKRGLTIKLTLEEYSDLVNALIYGHSLLATDGGTYKPLSRKRAVRGWLKLEHENDAGKINVLEVFVRVKVSGSVKFGDQGPQPPVEFEVLMSSANTGVLLGSS